MAVAPDVNISQTFVATTDNITGLFVVPGVLDKNLKGTLHLKLAETLRSKNGQTIEGERLVSASRNIDYQSDFAQF